MSDENIRVASFTFTREELAKAIAPHGLHIVTEAEKRVLAECMAIPEYALRSPIIYAEQFHPLRDELERLRRTP